MPGSTPAAEAEAEAEADADAHAPTVNTLEKRFSQHSEPDRQLTLQSLAENAETLTKTTILPPSLHLRQLLAFGKHAIFYFLWTPVHVLNNGNNQSISKIKIITNFGKKHQTNIINAIGEK